MSYWLHRISHFAHVSYPLIDAGFLSIGYSSFSTDGFIENALNENEQEFNRYFQDSWGYLPRNRWTLWNFLSKMRKGDIVLVPSWGTFSIYRIIGEKPNAVKSVTNTLPQKDWNGNDVNWNDVDLGFIWKVEPVVKNIPRNLYADSALTSRMKVRQTNVCINDLKKNVDESIKAFNERKPIDLKAAIVEKSAAAWKQSIQEKLNADKFEKLVRWYLEKIGADISEVQPKNYNGKVGDVDVVARFEKIKTCIDVQVKFHKGTTSEWSVNQILDFVNSQNDSDEYYWIPWVITSADSFSKEAELKAKEKNIRLICMDEFIRMLMDVGLDKMESFN